MPAHLEPARQNLVIQDKARHFFANTQSFARAIEVRVQNSINERATYATRGSVKSPARIYTQGAAPAATEYLMSKRSDLLQESRG